jgi:hypothetical protein
MTEKDAFKAGFLARCAEEGLTGAELSARINVAADVMTKRAFNPMALLPNDPMALLPNFSQALGATKMLAGAGLLGAGVAGGLAGHVAGTLNQPDLDEEDIKARELAAAYKALAAKARTNRKLRVYRPE